MKFDKSDPRLTAYALGESAESDKKIIEAALAADPELQKELIKIKAATSFLFASASSEELRLDSAQREKIFNLAKPQISWFSRYWKISAGLVTASLALMIFTQNRKSMLGTKVSQDLALSESQPMQKTANAPAAKPIPAQSLSGAKQFTATPSSGAQGRGSVAAAPAPPPAAAAAEEMPAKREQEVSAPSVAVNKDSAAVAAGGASAPTVPADDFAMADKIDSMRERPTMVKKMMAADSKAKSADGGQGTLGAFASAARSSGAGFKSAENAASKSISLVTLSAESSAAKAANGLAQKHLISEFENCFQDLQTKYVKYQLEISLRWNIRGKNVTDLTISQLGEPKVINDQIKKCLTNAIVSVQWPEMDASQAESIYTYKLLFRN